MTSYFINKNASRDKMIEIPMREDYENILLLIYEKKNHCKKCQKEWKFRLATYLFITGPLEYQFNQSTEYK